MRFVALRRASLLLVLLGCVAVGPAMGQEDPDDEVLLSGIHQSGGYGAPTVTVTSVNGEAAILTGGQGGWIINRQFVIGGGGRGLTTRPEAGSEGAVYDIQMGYGGLLLEYIGAPSRLLHAGGEVLIGAGGAQLTNGAAPDDDFGDDDEAIVDETSFFASEAGARLELNVTSFFRLGLSGGYRLILGSDLRGVSDADLGGPYGRLSFRFGSF